MRYGCSCVVVVILLGGLAAGSARGQDRPNLDAVRQRWVALSEQQRREVRENYQRWQRMGAEEREVLRRRHRRLESLRDEIPQRLSREERSRWESLPETERRQDVDRRVRERLRGQREQLPPELRRRLETEARRLPLQQREARTRELFLDEVMRHLHRRVRELVDEGTLGEGELDRVRALLQSRRPQERFRRLRELILRHPEAFDLPDSLLEPLRRGSDPQRVMRAFGESLRRREAQETRRRLQESRKQQAERSRRALRRRLIEQGVPATEVDAALSAPEFEQRQRVRELMQRHGVEPPGATRTDRGENGRGRQRGGRRPL